MASKTMMAMVGLAVSLLALNGRATAQERADVVIVVPQGYEVTHTAVPATTGTELAPPPPTRLEPPATLGATTTTTADTATSRRANKGLVIPGAISLGVGYVGNVIGTSLYSLLRAVTSVDNTDEFFFLSLVPIAGPWLQLPFASTDMEVGFLVGAGLLQAGGLTMLIAGLTFGRRTVVDEVAIGDTSVAIHPMIGGDAVGLTASGTF